MTYQVLARKYRPQTFEDVIAQDHVTITLRNAISAKRIGSGYIFCGPRGAGKTTVARLLAKAVNCVNGPTPNPCGECDSCLSIANGSSLDVLEIDAASNTSVDDIRNVRENIRYLPSVGRRRIYIIDEVHRLSGPAFDALLKTLEEPPAHAMFIFATTEAQKVPDTILSRTQRFDFRRVGLSDLTALLAKIAAAEGCDVDPDALRLVARKGDGSARDSISLLDQLLSFSGGRVTAALVTQALGLVDRDFLFTFVDALANAQTGVSLTMIAELAEGGAEFKTFATELSEHYRILTAICVTGSTAPGVDLTSEELGRYRAQVGAYTIGDLVRISEILAKCIADMSDVDQRWALEIAALKIATMESTIRLEEVLARLDAGESLAPQARSREFDEPDDLFANKAQPTPARPVTRYATDTRTASVAPTNPTVVSRMTETVTATAHAKSGQAPSLADLQALWPKFVESVRGVSMMISSQVGMVTPQSLRANQLTATLPPSGAATKSLLEKPEYRAQIEKALGEFFGAPLTIKYDVAEQSAPVAPAAEKKAVSSATQSEEAQRVLSEEPRLQAILDKVNGEIVRVRKINGG